MATQINTAEVKWQVWIACSKKLGNFSSQPSAVLRTMMSSVMAIRHTMSAQNIFLCLMPSALTHSQAGSLYLWEQDNKPSGKQPSNAHRGSSGSRHVSCRGFGYCRRITMTLLIACSSWICWFHFQSSRENDPNSGSENVCLVSFYLSHSRAQRIPVSSKASDLGIHCSALPHDLLLIVSQKRGD